MRYLFPVFLPILFVSISAWAGTWRDDFNDGDLDGWRMDKHIWKERVIPDAGNWWVEDGVVIGGEEAPGVTHALTVKGGWDWSDYTVEVSVKLIKQLQLWQAVSLYLTPDGNKASGLEVRNVLGSVVARGFIYEAPAMANPIGPWKPFKIEVSKWYRLKIKIVERIDDEEGIVQCFIDDQPILQFQGYRKGTPGFSVYQTIAMFDDFVVTGPDIPDGGSGAKAVRPKGKLATTWARVKMF